MTWSKIATGTVAQNTGNPASISAVPPGGYQDGDLLVFRGAGNGAIATGPSSQGYTSIANSGSGANVIAAKIASGTESNITYSMSGSGSIQAYIEVFRSSNGVVTSLTAINTGSGSTASGSQDIATGAFALTGSPNNALVLFCGSKNGGSYEPSTLDGGLSTLTGKVEAQGTNVVTTCAYEIQTSSHDYATGTVNYTGTGTALSRYTWAAFAEPAGMAKLAAYYNMLRNA